MYVNKQLTPFIDMNQNKSHAGFWPYQYIIILLLPQEQFGGRQLSNKYAIQNSMQIKLVDFFQKQQKPTGCKMLISLPVSFLKEMNEQRQRIYEYNTEYQEGGGWPKQTLLNCSTTFGKSLILFDIFYLLINASASRKC